MRSLLAQVAATVAATMLLLSGCANQSPPRQIAVVFSSSAEAAARSVESSGGQVTHRLPLINAVGASISEHQLGTLTNDTGLLRIVVADNAPRKNEQHATSQSDVTTWLTKSLKRPALNDKLNAYVESTAPTLRGRGIGIALIDTGIASEASNVMNSAPSRHTFNALSNTVGDVEDRTGHGTHLASLILGFGPNFRGIAPDADIIAIKAFDQEDTASTLDIVRAIQWVVDNRAKHNIRVLNLSISAPTDLPYHLDPMNVALTNAWNEGLIVVVSAGNGGPEESSITAPGNNPWLITVGAADYRNDAGWTDIAPFSGRGPTDTGHIKPDIIVPGTLLAGVRVDDAKRPETEPDHRDPQGFWITSGASQASAVASGFIALLLEARPDLSNHDVKCILANTASPLSSETNVHLSPFAQGRGLMNLAAALKSSATHCEERLEGLDPSLPLKGAFSPQ